MRLENGFDPALAAKTLLREARSGAIATLLADGAPYSSLVNVATEPDGSPVLLISQLAIHTRNLLADPRISLMLDERKPGDPLEGTRIMLIGRAERTESVTAPRRFLARHPDAAGYASFVDFGYFHLVPSRCHLVAGFGRIVDLEAEQFLTLTDDAESLTAAEDDICAHMNTDHADAVRLYATKLLGAPDGDWRCIGCDPEGLELQDGRQARRLFFPERVTSPGALRRVLKLLADPARGIPPTQ